MFPHGTPLSIEGKKHERNTHQTTNRIFFLLKLKKRQKKCEQQKIKTNDIQYKRKPTSGKNTVCTTYIS